jgi:DNA-directed RNA polymerase subunit L
MSNVPIVFESIIHGELRPWLDSNKSDMKFAPMLSIVETVSPAFPVVYEIDFIRPFNNKTKYYSKLILNETNSYCNRIVELINEDKNEQLMKYWLNDTLNKRLKTRIKEVGKLINQNDYSLVYINPHKLSFDKDTDHKTETYVFQLLKVALIKTYLEIQDVFKSLIKDDILIEEDFYTQLLNEPIPEKSALKPVPKPIIVEDAAPAEYIKAANNQTVNAFNSFTYKQLNTSPDYINDLCDGLKNKGFIADDTSKTDFRKIFSGKEITKPITWTGTISDLHYFVKLIHNINKSVIDLKQHQWEVACKCFIRSDGSSFDRQQLKEQKKPKSTSTILEKIASNLA